MKAQGYMKLVAVTLIGLGSLIGCSKGGKAENSIKILSISPSDQAELKGGTAVEIVVEVEYSLKEPNGSIALVVQKDDAMPSIASSLGNSMEAIKKGTGKVTLRVPITVPNGNSIQIFTPLSIPGEAQTTVVDMRVLNVTQ